MDSSSSLKGSLLGKLVLSSGLLDLLWTKISELHGSTNLNEDSGLVFEIFHGANHTFVVFDAPPSPQNSSFHYDSTPLAESQDQNPFRFLCSEKFTSFSVDTPAFQLFSSAYNVLSDLKDKLRRSNKPLVITGAALGGSVAALFALMLLETFDPRRKLPLCVTFGSPLIGDAYLQQILEKSGKESCFLHVADAAQSLTTNLKPFGTFLICFDSECICINDPEAVMELLVCDTRDQVDWIDFGEILQHLIQSSTRDSRPMSMMDDIFDRMDERKAKKEMLYYDPLTRVNAMRIQMLYMEYYRKLGRKNNIGYYDLYKSQIEFPTPLIFNVEDTKRGLDDYWKSVVEDAEKINDKWNFKRVIYAGANYRRLIEPLDIAEYYLRGGNDYRNSGRSHHYVMLEKWFGNVSVVWNGYDKIDLTELLMFDSCFWAEVEEALIVINKLKTHVRLRDKETNLLMEKIVKFEEYVWGMIIKRAVSPEIFFERSSFMKWWKEYKEIRRSDGFNFLSSPFTEFMNTEMYKSYGLPYLGNHISGSATGPPPSPTDRPKSSIDKEKRQRVVQLKLKLPSNEEKTKAHDTIAMISGVSSVDVDVYERITVTVTGNETLGVLLEKLSKYWPVQIISVGPSKEIEQKEETSEEQSKKQVEMSVETQKIKDEESVLSGDSGLAAIDATNTSILVISWNNNLDAEEKSFIKSILKALHERGVTPLTYNLSGTESLDTEMLHKSSVGIMVLSNNFARSGKSLDLLVAIMEHWKAKHLVIIPVYVKVTPLGIFRLEDWDDWVELSVQPEYVNSVQKWKAAMNELVSIDGHDWAEGTQFTLAEEIARDAWLYLRNCKNVVRILALLKHSQPSDAEIVGLWGMAGIGKTFIARKIYDILAPQYHSCCILEDFYRLRKEKGLRQMRDDFFSNIFGEGDLNACDIKPSSMRAWFLNKKILVVLDGVGSAKDAEYVVGGFDWFSRGHRIILTSRRKQVLVQCKVKIPFEINKLCEFESFRLCKQHFIGEKSGIISELRSCSSGIPLALEVMASSISKEQNKENMKDHLQSLRINPPDEIRKAFQRSFDGLDENEKNIFLDLSCFFGGEDKDHVVQLLDACGYFTSLGIRNLIDESLISLLDNKIEIPIPFQDMGRFVVREEDEHPCKRRRLWDSKDIIGVLTNNLGTEAIEGIFLDVSDLTCDLSSTVFCEMDSLRLLKFYCSASGKECKLNLSPQGLDILPCELRLLHWEHYPLRYLPQKFDPENLVEINMPYSDMEKLWEGKKNLEKLKKIKLSHSKKLTDILMLSEALNLEHIDIEGCSSLVDISTSIPLRGKLVSMNMKDCSHLRSLPAMVDLTYLNFLNLSGCSELEEIQDCAPNLKELFLAETAITKLPLSIANLTGLVTLDLENCTRLQQLPSRIRKSIINLNTSGCTSLSVPKRKPLAISKFHEYNLSVSKFHDYKSAFIDSVMKLDELIQGLTEEGISVSSLL